MPRTKSNGKAEQPPSTRHGRAATSKLCEEPVPAGWPAGQAASAAQSRQDQRHVGFTPRDEPSSCLDSLIHQRGAGEFLFVSYKVTAEGERGKESLPARKCSSCIQRKSLSWFPGAEQLVAGPAGGGGFARARGHGL
jgi:hypothetical protein